jgi:hypothetical protein
MLSKSIRAKVEPRVGANLPIFEQSMKSFLTKSGVQVHYMLGISVFHASAFRLGKLWITYGIHIKKRYRLLQKIIYHSYISSHNGTQHPAVVFYPRHLSPCIWSTSLLCTTASRVLSYVPDREAKRTNGLQCRTSQRHRLVLCPSRMPPSTI